MDYRKKFLNGGNVPSIDAVILNKTDNVAAAVEELKDGQTAMGRLKHNLNEIRNNSIPYGYRFSVLNIRCGENIF
jgi:altronate dehydratase small subunit